MKTCSRCNVEKALDAFGKNKSRPDGLHPTCKACRVIQSKKSYEKNKDTILAKQKDPLKYRVSDLKRKFGLTLEQYAAMLEKQKGVCAICGNEDTIKLAVDHNHTTDAVRGLLCRKCNMALGLFNDNIALLLNAINYLQQYNGG